MYLISTKETSNPPPIRFTEDQNEEGTYYAHLQIDIEVNLTSTILILVDKDLNGFASYRNIQSGVTHYTIRSNGDINYNGLNCTFYDKNQNHKLDKEDEFIIKNVAKGDHFTLHYGSEVYYHEFK
jgi:hypothetical protein